MLYNIVICISSKTWRIFAGYLKDNVDSFVCFEKVTNRSAMRKYFAPDNDFIIYSTAVAEPVELLARVNAG